MPELFNWHRSSFGPLINQGSRVRDDSSDVSRHSRRVPGNHGSSACVIPGLNLWIPCPRSGAASVRMSMDLPRFVPHQFQKHHLLPGKFIKFLDELESVGLQILVELSLLILSRGLIGNCLSSFPYSTRKNRPSGLRLLRIAASICSGCENL